MTTLDFAQSRWRVIDWELRATRDDPIRLSTTVKPDSRSHSREVLSTLLEYSTGRPLRQPVVIQADEHGTPYELQFDEADLSGLESADDGNLELHWAAYGPKLYGARTAIPGATIANAVTGMLRGDQHDDIPVVRWRLRVAGGFTRAEPKADLRMLLDTELRADPGTLRTLLEKFDPMNAEHRITRFVERPSGNPVERQDLFTQLEEVTWTQKRADQPRLGATWQVEMSTPS